MLIYRYSFEIRNSGWIEKEAFKISRNRLHQSPGGKNPAAPTLNLNLNGVYCFAEVGGQTPKQNRTAAHINSGFYYFHSSMLFHFDGGCAVGWGTVGAQGRTEVRGGWRCYLTEWNKRRPPAPHPCPAPSQGFSSCWRSGWSPSSDLGHSSSFQDVLRATGHRHCFPFSPRGFHQTPLTLKAVSSPSFT